MSKKDMRQVLALITREWIASGHAIKRYPAGKAWKYGYLHLR
jgi:hypothetical protein